MADDSVVEIGHVEGTIRAKLDIHGAIPWIRGGEKVGLFDGCVGCTVPVETIPVDSAGHHIAAEKVVPVGRGKSIIDV